MKRNLKFCKKCPRCQIKTSDRVWGVKRLEYACVDLWRWNLAFDYERYGDHYFEWDLKKKFEEKETDSCSYKIEQLVLTQKL